MEAKEREDFGKTTYEVKSKDLPAQMGEMWNNQRKRWEFSEEITTRSEKELCVVLMPFDERFSNHFDIIKSTIDKNIYDIKRLERYEGPEPIARSIIRNILKADVIIADLSGNNPNVFYELGIAHSLMRKVILVSDDQDTVPFDVSAYFVHVIPEDVGADQVWHELDQSLKAVRKQAASKGPVSEVIGGVIGRIGQPLFLRRFIAFSIDFYVVALPIYLFGENLGLVGESASDQAMPETGGQGGDGGILGFFIFFGFFLYHWLIVAMFGRTVGKFICGVRVRDFDSNSISWWRAGIRSAVQLLGYFSVGFTYFIALLGPSYMTLHDRWSGTMVVRARWRRRTGPRASS